MKDELDQQENDTHTSSIISLLLRTEFELTLNIHVIETEPYIVKLPFLYIEEEYMANKANEHQLVLSADVKTRLKWTQQLHQCFVDAVSQLGGADKATPKSVLRVMGIPGITLYHLKSHLQKYRLSKYKDHKVNDKNEDTMAADCRLTKNVIIPFIDKNKNLTQFHDPKTMLQLQMEVQRKLQEQIEVQKHLQLRIEAQGKYLESVVMKAQETLANYSLNSLDLDFSQATTSVCKQFLNAYCSTDSCLTSSDIMELKNRKQHNIESSSDCSNSWSAESNEINQCHYNKVEDIDLNS